MNQINNEISLEIDNRVIIDNGTGHNGKPINQVEASPNGKYLVTYSEEDHSIVGWIISGGQLKSEFLVNYIRVPKRFK
jgi:hypothetical protein